MSWKKSTFSTGNGECVEVAHDGKWVLIRDSKFPSGLVLRFTATEFRAFVEGVQRGEFDL